MYYAVCTPVPFRRKPPGQAIYLCDRILALTPNNVQVLRTYSVCLKCAGRVLEANDAMSRAYT